MSTLCNLKGIFFIDKFLQRNINKYFFRCEQATFQLSDRKSFCIWYTLFGLSSGKLLTTGHCLCFYSDQKWPFQGRDLVGLPIVIHRLAFCDSLIRLCDSLYLVFFSSWFVWGLLWLSSRLNMKCSVHLSSQYQREHWSRLIICFTCFVLPCCEIPK